MAFSTEQFRNSLENEYPIDIIAIFVTRSEVRIQYREQNGDDNIDRQLRKAHITESAETFVKKSAYMDEQLHRDSEMMMQLGAGIVDITVQRISNKSQSSLNSEYRLRQDIILNSDKQYLFATKIYPLTCKDEANIAVQALRKRVCADDKKKYILDVQFLETPEYYSSIARFHTTESYSSIMNLKPLD